MRGYKIVTQIFLILSVINFALTAPTVVREHQVRGIGSNDGPGPSNPAASPEIPQIVSSPDKPYSSKSWVPTDSDYGSSHPPGSPQIAALPESPQIVSLPGK